MPSKIRQWVKDAALTFLLHGNYDEWISRMQAEEGWSEDDCNWFLKVFHRFIREELDNLKRG